MYRYVLTREAEQELDAELAYSAERWGKRNARDYAEGMRQKLISIAENPFSYPERDDILPGIRICTYKGNRIIYTVHLERKQVIILGLQSIYRELKVDQLSRRESDK